jgi:hypothetical protein
MPPRAIAGYRKSDGLNRPREHGMKSLAAFIGILLLLSGLFFAAQGAGYIQWPARSFMVDERNWIYYGAAIALAGVVLFVASRR